jgi:hypothetical protein
VSELIDIQHYEEEKLLSEPPEGIVPVDPYTGYPLNLVLDSFEAINDPLGAREKIRHWLYERYGPPAPPDPEELDEEVYIPSTSLIFLLKRQGVSISLQTLVHWADAGKISRRLMNRSGGQGGKINHYNPYEVYEEYYVGRKGRHRNRKHWDVNCLVQEWRDGIGS